LENGILLNLNYRIERKKQNSAMKICEKEKLLCDVNQQNAHFSN
jgi:hypothetical protein